MQIKIKHVFLPLSAALLIGSIGCGPDPKYTISGTITRADHLIPNDDGGDGIGDVYLQLMNQCPSVSGCTPEYLQDIVVPNVDLSVNGMTGSFTMSPVKNGTYYIAGIMDDAVNTKYPENISETGDLMMFGLASPRCVEVIVADGDVTDVSANFDSVVPFVFPTYGETCDNVVTDPVEDPIIPDDGNTYVVSASVVRSVEADYDTFGQQYLGLGDGIGTMRMGLLTGSCFETNGDQGTQAAEFIMGDDVGEDPVDLSAAQNIYTFDFPAVPNGVYYINGFIDDAVANPTTGPLPSTGDLVSFLDLGPACVRVIVDGGDVTAATYYMNFVMPFDLNAVSAPQ